MYKIEIFIHLKILCKNIISIININIYGLPYSFFTTTLLFNFTKFILFLTERNSYKYLNIFVCVLFHFCYVHLSIN